jgi:hypothetical protein
MRKFFAALIIAIFLVSISCTLVFAQSNQTEVNQVLQEDEDIRQLQAKSSIQVNYLSQDELRQKMIEDFQTELPEDQLLDTQNIMVMMGYIPQGLDLEKLLIDLYTEQVAGFYEVKDKSMYLISQEKTSMSAMDKYILSHELVHFLQDQNFDLNRPPFNDSDSPVKTDDDGATAATALVEGDAQTTSDSWLVENMSSSDMMELQQQSGQFSTQVLDNAPDYIKDGLMFPYEEGQTFVKYLKRKGGYSAVDAAYKNPPKSTEQIYHPEKYTANENPVDVSLPDDSMQFGEGWTLAYENILGEFDVYELFKPYFTNSTAEQAGAGWGGNKYQYYSNDAGDKLLVQDYAWDTETDAQEFSSAYIKLLDARFKSDLKTEASDGAWQVWSGGGYQLGIKKDGLNTYLLQSTTEEPFQTMMNSIGQTGDPIDESAIGGDEIVNPSGSEKDYKWLIVAGVAGLFALGLILLIVMFVLMRKPPTPPGPPGGPYGSGYYGPPGPWGGGPRQGVPPPPVGTGTPPPPGAGMPPPPGWGNMPPPPPPANQG